jgi:hypothetical protein
LFLHVLVDTPACPPPPVLPLWLDLPPEAPPLDALVLFELPPEHEALRSAKATATMAKRCCDLMNAPNREVWLWPMKVLARGTRPFPKPPKPPFAEKREA